MNELDFLYLTQLAQNLHDMPREGKSVDLPEGVRFIKISDTLARQIASRLDLIAHRNKPK